MNDVLSHLIRTSLRQMFQMYHSFQIQENTFLSRNRIIHLYISTQNPTTHRHNQGIFIKDQKRFSSISFHETEFNKAKITYETALRNSGYQATLKFEKPSQNTRRNRNRKVIWFNPPFSLNVKTNAGKEFFKLIRRHFPRNHGFSKIFNLNTIKISFSSMKNMNNLIKQQNARF